jgi:hypothetical protein
MTLSAAEIGNIGERHATAALQAKGWQCYRNTQQPGATDIEATSGTKGMLVQVKTGLAPNSAPELSADEFRSITARAGRKGYEAWSARLQINGQGALVGSIAWQKLN